ncbi:MAG TPA: hypothetical protein VGN20_02085 [Mucilaginibacter sp.]|jgi:hypothetical protein
MIALKLNNEFSFAIERCEKRARLIVYKNGLEDVCRKETFGNLQRFILADQGHLFKGRLQLDKNEGNIKVEVKGELIGIINNDDFGDFLEDVKNQLFL